MATNYRHSGRRLPVTTASGTILSSAFVVQEGIYGVALNSATTGGTLWIGAEGVWNLPVPATTVKGDKLYAPGAPATEAVAPVLTKTAAGATIVGTAITDRDTLGYAEVYLAHNGNA